MGVRREGDVKDGYEKCPGSRSRVAHMLGFVDDCAVTVNFSLLECTRTVVGRIHQ